MLSFFGQLYCSLSISYWRHHLTRPFDNVGHTGRVQDNTFDGSSNNDDLSSVCFRHSLTIPSLPCDSVSGLFYGDSDVGSMDHAISTRWSFHLIVGHLVAVKTRGNSMLGSGLLSCSAPRSRGMASTGVHYKPYVVLTGIFRLPPPVISCWVRCASCEASCRRSGESS